MLINTIYVNNNNEDIVFKESIIFYKVITLLNIMCPLYNYFNLLGFYYNKYTIINNANFCLKYMQGSYSYHNDIKNSTLKDILQFIKNINTFIEEDKKDVK